MTPSKSGIFTGGEAASIAAIQFWVDCVRREHHGYKFNSYPALFAALDAVEAAAINQDATSVVRQAKHAHRLFRKDEHAYWPRLDARWQSAEQFSLLFSPAWYFVSKIVYPGQAFLLVTVQIKPDWHCQVTWSAQATESGPFPAFHSLTDRVDLNWSVSQNRAEVMAEALGTRVLSYDTPSSQWPF